MGASAGSTVTIQVEAGGRSWPPIQGIPWFPGITVLSAMVVGQAMTGPSSFTFRAVYHSEYGAYVDMIDDASEGGGKYWMLYLGDGSDYAPYGPAEQIIAEAPEGATIIVRWSLELPGQSAPAHVTRRIAAA